MTKELAELQNKVLDLAAETERMIAVETDAGVCGELIGGADSLRDFAGTLELRMEVGA
jgi:hypothetical protein